MTWAAGTLNFTSKKFYSDEAELSFEHFSSFLIIHGSINILQPDRCSILGHSRKILGFKILCIAEKKNMFCKMWPWMSYHFVIDPALFPTCGLFAPVEAKWRLNVSKVSKGNWKKCESKSAETLELACVIAELQTEHAIQLLSGRSGIKYFDFNEFTCSLR